MFRPAKLCVNHQCLERFEDREHVVEGPTIELTWAALSDAPGARQAAYRVRLDCDGEKLLDTRWVQSGEQRCVIDKPLPKG